MEEARASGILYVGMPSEATWPPMGIQDIALVDWSVVASQLPGIVSVVLVTLMSIVLNSRALEAAIGVDFDLDREFRVGGVACLVAGMGGSPPGCNANTMCLITHAAGAHGCSMVRLAPGARSTQARSADSLNRHKALRFSG